MIQRDILLRVLDALDKLGIPYMITGSFASNYWGRPRTTHDADLVVEMPPDKAIALAHELGDEFYAPDFALQEAAEGRGHANLIHLQQAFKVDLWTLADTDYDRERFRRRVRGSMFERAVWVTTAEDTILSKLLWFKTSPVLERQLRDALEVYEIQEPYLEQAYLEHWAGTLGVADLLSRIREDAARPPSA
jgi:hypothetical protein